MDVCEFCMCVHATYVLYVMRALMYACVSRAHAGWDQVLGCLYAGTCMYVSICVILYVHVLMHASMKLCSQPGGCMHAYIHTKTLGLLPRDRL